MFNENNFSDLSYAETADNHEYQQTLSYPVYQTNIYQENINKCLSSVNYDYNSYDAAESYDSLSISTSNDGHFLRDSGNASESYENSVFYKKTLHTHQQKKDQDECKLCRETTFYLLSTPFINYFDFTFPKIKSKISMRSDEINYDEYKIFDNFRFANLKRVSQTDLPQNFHFMSPCLMQNGMRRNQTEFELNGKLEKLHEQEDLQQQQLPMIQRYDYRTKLLEFQPSANSTPSKYLLDQRQTHVSDNSINTNSIQMPQQSNFQQQFLTNSDFTWKKPIVLDPRLSTRYDAVFPPLEESSIYNYRNQTHSIMENFQINYCVFCKNNQKPPEVYMTHILRDSSGRTCCPLLRKYKCPRCGAVGDTAHTNKYCPKNPKSNIYLNQKQLFFIINN